jgi:hypothetical protein
MLIVNYLFLFLILFAGIRFLIKKLDFSPALAPFTIIAASTIILYIGALTNLLKPFVYLVVCINVLLGILSFIPFKTDSKPPKKVGVPAIIAWGIIFILLILYTRDTLFYHWDEFSYWGVIYRYLMTTNHLPDISSNFLITNYPPFTGLLQYFVGNILGNKESSAYFAQMLLEFSALIAILPSFEWKKWKEYLLIFTVSLLSIFALDFVFQTLYADLLLGLLFAAAISAIRLDEGIPVDRTVTIVLAATALCLIKPTGIIFTVVIAVLVFFKLAVHTLSFHSWKEFFKTLPRSLFAPQNLIVLLLPLIFALSWSLHSAQFNNQKAIYSLQDTRVKSTDIFPWVPTDYTDNLKRQEYSENIKNHLYEEPHEIYISLQGLINSFSIDAPYRSKVVFSSLQDRISNETFSTSKVTVLQLFLLILIVTWLIGWFTKEPKRNQKQYWGNTIILVLASIGYILFLYVAYIYYFGTAEALSTPSARRYCSSFLLGWWLALFSQAITYEPGHTNKLNLNFVNSFIGVFAFLLLFIVNPSSYLHLPFSPDPERFVVSKIYNTVKNKLTDPDVKVYDVYQTNNSQGYTFYIMKYLLTPIPSNNFGWQMGEKTDPLDSLTVDISASDWLKLLHDQQYTYVLISSADDQFWTRYGTLFDTFSKTEYPQLYQVTNNGLQDIPLDK